MDIEIRRIEHEGLVNSLFSEYRDFFTIQCKEIYPDDNPESDEQILEHLNEDDCEVYRFAAFDQDRIAGCMSSGKLKPSHPEYAIRKHISWLNGYVLPEFRGKGIGSQLAGRALQIANENGVELVNSNTFSNEGEAFMAGLGARLVSASSERVLDLSKLDWSIVDGWTQKSFGNLKLEYCPEMSEDFIGRTIDISYASTLETMTMDNCEVPPTKEGEFYNLREYAKFMKNTSMSYHCLILSDQDGNIYGFTEGTITPEDPEIFNQGMTMVWKHHRGNGYGKFLKASMLDHIRKNLPQIKKVTTGNNDLNKPMLAINLRLGFQLIRQWNGYRLVVADAIKKLEPK